MTARGEPPDRRGGASTPGSADHHQHQSLTKEDQHPQDNAPTRQCRPTGDVFRDGFARGFVDGLRLLCREVDDPAVWTAAHHLSAGGGDR
jgi:hypothetical protein